MEGDVSYIISFMLPLFILPFIDVPHSIIIFSIHVLCTYEAWCICLSNVPPTMVCMLAHSNEVEFDMNYLLIKLMYN